MLSQLGLTTFLFANYWESGKDFLEDYQHAFQEKPYVTSFVQWRWFGAHTQDGEL